MPVKRINICDAYRLPGGRSLTTNTFTHFNADTGWFALERAKHECSTIHKIKPYPTDIG